MRAGAETRLGMAGLPELPGRVARLGVLGALWLYKRTLSPAFYLLGARCRHEPSCSEYAAEAFRRHRFGRAFWLTVSRLSRCHPWGSWGFDPPPETSPDVGWRFWRLGDWAWTERGGGAPAAPSCECKGAEPPGV